MEMELVGKTGSSQEIAKVNVESDGAHNATAAKLSSHFFLTEITKHLPNVEDQISMAETCPYWRNAFASTFPGWSKAPPCLMFDCEESNTNANANARHVFSLLNGRNFQLELPEARGKRVWGSPHGWLATVTDNLLLQLLNPISQKCIDLPNLSLTKYNWDMIYKICVLKIKTDPIKLLVVMILYPGDILAYTWVGDVDAHNEWLFVNNPEKRYFNDVSYVLGKDQVYGLCDNGCLVRINLGESVSAKDQVEFVANLPGGEFDNRLDSQENGRLYLVDSDDAVFVVYRYSQDIGEDHKTTRFVLYRLNFDPLVWEAATSIEEKTFFIGRGNSWSISRASTVNCKNNSIYFSDDNLDRNWIVMKGMTDIGVYDMETRLVEWLNFGAAGSPPPGPGSTWITPGLSPIHTFKA